MASIAIAEPQMKMHAPLPTCTEADDSLERGMRVTFDTRELAAFYASFDALEDLTRELFVACGIADDEQTLARVA